MRAGLILFGWVMIGLAFLSLVGEMAARGQYGSRVFFLSAEELWAALAPESFTEFRTLFRSAARPFWTYFLGPLLMLPAWLLFGLPGILAFGYAHRLDRTPREFDVEEAFLFDELVKRAKEEGHVDPEDRAPEDSYEPIAASAREAEADMIRDPIVPPPRAAEKASPGPEPDANGEKPPRFNLPPS